MRLLHRRRDHPIRAKVTDVASEDEVLHWAEEYARENGWILNPDRKTLEAVVRGLARNEERFGARYCPCRLRSGDPDRDRAIICPCAYHRDEIEREGHCHCRLYYRENAPGQETLDGERKDLGD